MNENNHKLNYYQRHRERRLAYQNEYYKQNRDEIRKQQRVYFYIYYYFGPKKKLMKAITAKEKYVDRIVVTF